MPVVLGRERRAVPARVAPSNRGHPLATAVAVYLHISVVVPILASGFWLIASERFDPRAAKRLFGQIAAAGTLGGLAGALIAERIAVWYGRVVDARRASPLLQFVAAGLVRVLAVSDPVDTAACRSTSDERRTLAASQRSACSPGAAPALT